MFLFPFFLSLLSSHYVLAQQQQDLLQVCPMYEIPDYSMEISILELELPELQGMTLLDLERNFNSRM